MLKSAWTRPSRAASGALLFALVWGVGLAVAGLLVPFYEVSSVSSSGEATGGAATLVQVNGPRVLVVLAVPIVLTVLVAGSLLLRARRGALLLAWTLTGVLAVLNLLAMLSIGLFVVPITAALVVACSTSRTDAEHRSPASGTVVAG